MQQNRSLNQLLLIHELIFVLLVILAGIAGGYGIYLWRAASDESVRIGQLSMEVQQTRGDLYRQMKELFDAQFLADPQAQTEYDEYTQRIEEHFRQLEALAQGADESSAIADMRAAYLHFLAETHSLLATGFVPDSKSLEKAFNSDLELNIFRHYEAVTDAAEKLFTRKQQRIHSRLRQADRFATVILAIPVILACLLLLFSRTFLQQAIARPLHDILRAAKEISRGKLQHQVPETGAMELAALASSINHMADDLARSREALVISEKQAAQGALVPVLAHNIRNPLASIRATAQVADDTSLHGETREALKDIIDTVDRLERWTGSLLAYLHPLKPQLSATLLSHIVNGALALLKPRLKEKNVEIAMHGCEDRIVTVDIHLMEQAVYNLLANALEASPAKSVIEISAVQENDQIKLHIIDHGVGMPFVPEFDALIPGPSTKRFGTGLGIPFAFKVCEAHGGSVSFMGIATGGTQVTLSWPNPASFQGPAP